MLSKADAQLAELVETLRKARHAVDRELSALECATFLDPYKLGRVATAACSFASQADLLFDLMLSGGTSQDYLNEVENLRDFFLRVDKRVDVIIEAGRHGS